MPVGSAASRPRSFLPKAEQGDFVHVKSGKQKIQGTVIAKNGSEIVVSERGKYGAPQLHVIDLKKEDTLVAPTKTKKATYRSDASRFVDPYRQRNLTSELSLIKSQNALDFAVQGYDVKKDEFYIEGRLNAGSRFGKWVSAKDLIPLLDVNARGSVMSTDALIRNFAKAIGQEQALTERPKESASEKTKEEAKNEEIKPGETSTTQEEQAAQRTQPANEQDEEEDEGTPELAQVSATLIEKLKSPPPIPTAALASSAPSTPQKTNSRPDLKDIKSRVEDRLTALRGKVAGTTADRRAELRSSAQAASAQSARQEVVLGDAAFTAGAAVPALVLAYATAGGGQAPRVSQAEWQQAMRQVENLTSGLNTRLGERRAQFEALSLANAPAELVSESRSRVQDLEKASTGITQTLSAARGRRSAQELASLQTARSVNSPQRTHASAGQGQAALQSLRAQGGSATVATVPGIEGTQAIQFQVAGTLGDTLTLDLTQELRFESEVADALTARLNALQGELAQLQEEIAATEAAGQAAQAGLAQALEAAQTALTTLQAAKEAQAERVNAAKIALAQAEQALTQLKAAAKTGTTSDRLSDGPGTQAVKTLLASQVPTIPTPSQTAAPPTLGPKGIAPTGVPLPPPITGGSRGGALSAPSLGGAKPGTTPLARPGGKAPPAFRPLNPLPAGGAAAEFAALDRDRQQTRRARGDNGNRSVLDLPKKVWTPSDDEIEELDPEDLEEDDSFRDQVDDANQYLEQFQAGDGDGSFDENGNAFADSSSYAKQALGAMVAGEPLPGNLGEGLAQDVDNFRLLASSRALMARNEELRAQQAGQQSAAKIAAARKKRSEALEKEMQDKMEDIVELSGFEAILPVLKYIGKVYLSAANRNAGAFSLQLLPGYRPKLPAGADPDQMEKQWDLLLMLELCVVTFGMIGSFLLFVGWNIIMFFYFFGPLIGVIAAFCRLFGSMCHIGQ